MTYGEDGLCGKDTRHLALVLLLRGADNRRVVEQTVLGCVVLRLEGAVWCDMRTCMRWYGASTQLRSIS